MPKPSLKYKSVIMPQFDRSILLYGQAQFDKFAKSKVAIIGIGGVGSYVAEALVRAGIGSVLLVDNDTIDITNCNRQLWALSSTLGQAKVEVAQARLLDINPKLKIKVSSKQFCHASVDQFLDPSIDFVVDAIDSVEDKIELIKQSLQRNIPLISCMGAARRFDPTQVERGELFATTGCPLARKIRRQLRRAGIAGPIPIIHSKELPISIAPGSALPSGSTVPASVGLAAAAYVLAHI